MVTNYDKIRTDNIREYGEGTRHLSFLGRLYTDRTHFIFELLQNAEDAGATKIRFILFDDKLEVVHNGRHFNEKDVRGVCGVGEGTKTEDLTKIGKFGIGFKSVYAYTATPEVHSGDESFKIESYVRPYSVPSKATGQSWTTLFVFPFHSGEIPPETACNEIGVRLRNLSVRTLLFLQKINEIEYILQDSTDGMYLREEIQRESARQVNVIGQTSGSDEEESWLIFERSVVVPGNLESVCVEVGFQLKTDVAGGMGSERILKAKNTPLVVYFPTEKETSFGFLIQGPYRTTPSRDNAPKDDEWNENLVRETAELVRGALSEIKTLGLLSVSFLEALPIRTEDFPDEGMFYPIVEVFRSSLLDGEYLPTDDGSFVSARNAKLARGGDLRKLLNQEQLSQLFKFATTPNWLTGDITQDLTPDLRSYLINELDVEEVTPEYFARRINRSFLANQIDEWFVRFYGYLSNHEALWRDPLLFERDTGSILRSKPILRLEDGSSVIPFKSDGTTPNAFLPPPEETDYPIVNRSVVSNGQAHQFLERLGLSEPDVFDDIVKKVLPKYHAVTGENPVSDAEHQVNIRKIARAMNSDSETGKRKVIQSAKQTPFLKSIDLSGKTLFKKPAEIYLDTPELRSYFAGSQEVWFLCDKYALPDIDHNILLQFGVSNLPRKLRTSEGFPNEERERSTKKEIIENHDLEGLDYFLKALLSHDDFEEQKFSASVLWVFLRNYLEQDARFFKARYEWSYYGQKDKSFDSMVLVRLKNSRWIPTKEGSLKSPNEITKTQLFEKFLDATELIDSLEIAEGAEQGEDDRNREYATELGVSLEDIKFLKNHPNEIEQLKVELAAHKKGPEFPIASIENAKRRRERLRKQISEAPEKDYEERARNTRTTSGTIDPNTLLLQLYTNDAGQMVCQICKEEMPFRKRNGKYYFESIEILSREHLPKEHEAQYLALCPLCAAKYVEFVKNVDNEMDNLRKKIIDSEDTKISISLGDEETNIRFVETHFCDLKVTIEEVSTA